MQELIEEQARFIDQQSQRLERQEKTMRWLLSKLDRVLILPSDAEQP